MPSGTAERGEPEPGGSGAPAARWGALLVGVPALAAVYFISGKLGLRQAVANENATTVWPPTGIALAALLVFGIRLWPGVYLGALLVNLTTSGSWPASLGIAAGNTLEAVVGSFLIRRYAGGRRAFESVGNFFRFTLLAAVGSTMVSATCGIASLAASGALRSGIGAVWLTWWLGDLGGDLILAPFLILCSHKPILRWSLPRFVEGSLLVGSLFALSSSVFGGLLPFSPKNYAIGFLCIPIVLWSSFRFSPRYTSSILVLLSAVALWGTVGQFGTLLLESKIETLVFLQAFLGVISVTGLAAAAAVEERRKAADEVARKLAEVANLSGRLETQKRDIAVYHTLLSHDVTNIATALLGLVDRLLIQAHGPLTLRQEELVRKVNRQSLELSRMSENARTLVRLRERGLPPAGEPVLLREEIGRALQRVRDLHFDRPFECAVECPARATLAGVPLFESVLVNLIDNAVRHSSKKAPPEIGIRVSAANPSLTIEIKGGAPPAKGAVAGIFNGHADPDRTAPHGIGLILVREILDRAHGNIAAQVVSDRGKDVVEVRVSLPMVQGSRP